MRRKIFSVPLEFVLPALCRDDRRFNRDRKAAGLPPIESPFITCDGMPDDARIIDIRPNPDFVGTLDLLIESDTFPDVPPGYCLERMDVTMTTYTSYQTYLDMTGGTLIGHPTLLDLVAKPLLASLDEALAAGSVADPFKAGAITMNEARRLMGADPVTDAPAAKSVGYRVGEPVCEKTFLSAVLRSTDEVMAEVAEVMGREAGATDTRPLAILVRVPAALELVGTIHDRVKCEYRGSASRSAVGDTCGGVFDEEWVKITIPPRPSVPADEPAAKPVKFREWL